ncbi:acetyl-CoA synthetase-like protein [Corynespora cassiicola Philippines]|uniref:Acetyl-CoA synthetase-like protein n=1 Tax=Corynespora cassiicola Philippines TaxID=1448308 RepID=A0A2T2NXZ2_CORCC|nr:acetyl-CoA synthetase-like protein [Corynespora cassiicola Philippines]
MPFLAKEKLSIPAADILSWACAGPEYDENEPLYIDASNPSKVISAAQSKILIRQLVAGFRHAGLEKGDTVLLHSFNNIYYPILTLGIIAFGGIMTGTNPSYTANELKHALETTRAKFILTEPELIGTVLSASKMVSIPTNRVLSINSDNSSSSTISPWTTLLEHGEQDWLRFSSEKTSKKTIAMYLFSSGTTGLPKPAMLSHYNLIAQHTLVYEHRPRPYPLTRLVALPMFHAATAPGTHITPLRSGHKQYIMRRFEASAFLNYCLRFSITDLLLVPPLVTAMVSHPSTTPEKQSKLSTVRAAAVGAAPMDASMQSRFQALLPPSAPFTQMWGMTELSCFGSMFYYPDNDASGSVGQFLPNADVKLLDERGNDISGLGVRGELAVRAPNLVAGYLGVPRERDFDAEGYFRTGDIMFCAEETGLWYVVDRIKEMIKVRGFQVAPAEIEGVLLDHPQILDVAVIGIRSPMGDSEMPRAYVVRKGGQENGLHEKEVFKWVEERLAKYKRLEGGVRFLDVIPKTPSGKILKRELRELAKKETASKL